jgi:hypothetical protein
LYGFLGRRIQLRWIFPEGTPEGASLYSLSKASIQLVKACSR